MNSIYSNISKHLPINSRNALYKQKTFIDASTQNDITVNNSQSHLFPFQYPTPSSFLINNFSRDINKIPETSSYISIYKHVPFPYIKNMPTKNRTPNNIIHKHSQPIRISIHKTPLGNSKSFRTIDSNKNKFIQHKPKNYFKKIKISNIKNHIVSNSDNKLLFVLSPSNNSVNKSSQINKSNKNIKVLNASKSFNVLLPFQKVNSCIWKDNAIYNMMDIQHNNINQRSKCVI